MTGERITTATWMWWLFLLVTAGLALLLLFRESMALPVSPAATAIPIVATQRLLRDTWRTRRLVLALYSLLVASAVLLAVYTQPAPGPVPAWVVPVLGVYFMAAPVVITGAVLFELHRPSR